MDRKQAEYFVSRFYTSKPLSQKTKDIFVKLDTEAYRFVLACLEALPSTNEVHVMNVLQNTLTTVSYVKMLIRSEQNGSSTNS